MGNSFPSVFFNKCSTSSRQYECLNIGTVVPFRESADIERLWRFRHVFVVMKSLPRFWRCSFCRLPRVFVPLVAAHCQRSMIDTLQTQSRFPSIPGHGPTRSSLVLCLLSHVIGDAPALRLFPIALVNALQVSGQGSTGVSHVVKNISSSCAMALWRRCRVTATHSRCCDPLHRRGRYLLRHFTRCGCLPFV